MHDRMLEMGFRRDDRAPHVYFHPNGAVVVLAGTGVHAGGDSGWVAVHPTGRVTLRHPNRVTAAVDALESI